MSKHLSFKPGDKKQISFYWSRASYDIFRERYPNMTSYFLQRCMQRALNEKDFVENVMFGKISVQNY